MVNSSHLFIIPNPLFSLKDLFFLPSNVKLFILKYLISTLSQLGSVFGSLLQGHSFSSLSHLLEFSFLLLVFHNHFFIQDPNHLNEIHFKNLFLIFIIHNFKFLSPYLFSHQRDYLNAIFIYHFNFLYAYKELQYHQV
jgi:hypothetical protein